MKIRVLSRSDGEWSGAYDGGTFGARISNNRTAGLHAPQRPLELQRAVVAAKVNHLLARPFIGTLAPGHVDGVYALAKSRHNVALVASAAADGDIRCWHLPSKKPKFDITPQPAAFTRGLTFSHDSQRLLACTDARLAHSIRVDDPTSPLVVYRSGSGPLSSISAHYSKPFFATASANATVEIWDESRADPIQNFTFGSDSLHCVRFNPVETSILVSAASDRSIILYDTRLSSPVRKLVMSMRSNDISWNPIEAFNFTVANEDHNLYTFDMRKMSKNGALAVHKDHVAAVMSVDYAPTGREFVSGSYDKTIRLFDHTNGRSREVYHTKRMQRVFGVTFSLDAGYVISASDDGDVRIWKSHRSRPIVPQLPREKQRVATAEKLVERYITVPEVRRIAKKRNVPKHVLSIVKTKQEIEKSAKRKLANVRKNSKKGSVPKATPDRKKSIVRELE
jgi:DDB1- and CUL4-associated factor 13